MNATRLNHLLQFYKEDPKDPFNLYALATEYLSHQPEKALEYYEKLLIDFEDYLPTYYHAAKLYADLELPDKAEAIFQKGIELAKNQKEQMPLRELQNAYNEFLFEE